MTQQLTEEDLKKMSPEEIAALQKQNCIFCQIISGRVPSKKIYEDKEVIAILDIYPAANSHLLLLPKEHYSIMPQVPESTINHMGMVAKGLSLALLKGTGAKSTNIFIANGAVAGQKAAHFMLHIIPRKDNDGLDFEIPENKISDMQLEKVRGLVIKRLAMLMKKKENELVRDYENPEDVEMEVGPKPEKKAEAKKDESKKQSESQKEGREEIEEEIEKSDDESASKKPAKKQETSKQSKSKKGDEKKRGKENEKSEDDKDDENKDDEDEEGVNIDDIANLFS